MSEPKRTTAARGHTVRGAPGQETANVSVRLTLGEIERVRRLAVLEDRKLSAVCRRLILRGLPPVGVMESDLADRSAERDPVSAAMMRSSIAGQFDETAVSPASARPSAAVGDARSPTSPPRSRGQKHNGAK